MLLSRVVVMMGLLAFLIFVVATDAARDPALSHEENIKAALKSWERGVSGKPINCRRFVDLFIDEGVWSSPAGARNKSAPDTDKRTFPQHFNPFFQSRFNDDH
jgi:hypothetical protein